jgi:predicted acyltransferase
MAETNQRLLSLDIFRGLTIAGMILVNNPGSWQYKYAPLSHAIWNGLTPTDLVFPFFMFIMGITTCISLQRYDYDWNKGTILKIVRRTFVIYAIGFGLSWFSSLVQVWNAPLGEDFSLWSRMGLDRVRILGVLPRLAVCYGVVALIAISMKHKYIPYLVALFLAAYLCILYLGNGFEYGENNILSITDRVILGVKHMYNDNGIEPEGVLSTIPAIAHVLTGFYCGRILLETRNINEKIQQFFLIGSILTFSGFLLSYACPINKKIWSPSFVLVTCGMASSLLALLIWIIDVKEKKIWSRFFESFGINPLFMYVIAAIVSTFVGSIIRISQGENSISLQKYIYHELLQPFLGNYPASLAYSILFVVVIWVIGYILYKKRFYVKI